MGNFEIYQVWRGKFSRGLLILDETGGERREYYEHFNDTPLGLSLCLSKLAERLLLANDAKPEEG